LRPSESAMAARGPGATPAPRRSPTAPATPGALPTATRTPTATQPPPTTATQPAATGSLRARLELMPGGHDDAQRSDFYYRLVNSGSAAVTGITLRLYFTPDNGQAPAKYVLEKWWDQSGAASVAGPTVLSSSAAYFTVSYGGASLPPGGTWEYQTTLHLSDWSYSQSAANDWWHTTGPLPTTYADWPRLAVFVNGTLTFGATP